MLWAPNPYAIAALLANTPLFGDQSIYNVDGKSADTFLRNAFQADDKQRTLRDALGLFQQLTALVDSPKDLTKILAIEKIAQLVRKAEDVYGAAAIARVLPEILPVADKTFQSLGSNVGTWYVDAKRMITRDTTYLDPVQGNVGDCYLISAMIALAWMAPRELNAQLRQSGYEPLPAGSFSWEFRESGGNEGVSIKVTGRIPVIGTFPRYARSASPAEYWPGLIEKAYVLKRRRGLLQQAEPGLADYALINRDDEPQVACSALMGGRANSINRDTVFGKHCFAHLSRLCSRTTGVTTRPVMAWTLENIGTRNPEEMKDTGIWRNHAYAVLGKMSSGHVVLRNPHGFATKLWPGYAKEKWVIRGRAPVTLNQNGVFAISSELFDRYFDSLGWVTHRPRVRTSRKAES